jgi:RNA polymerase sigma-70 factor, ECF subfamily
MLAAASLLLERRTTARGQSAMTELRLYEEVSDAELLSRSAKGDRRAFEEIVVRHGSFALRVAARLVPEPSIAEDVAQDAMVRAWSQAGTFDPLRAHFRTWLYRIVINLCIDQRRRMRPEQMPEDFDPVDPAAGPYEVMAESQRYAALARALDDLPVRQRAALALVYDEGLSGAEAARVLGLSAKAVERLLARARGHLRECLRPEHDLKET